MAPVSGAMRRSQVLLGCNGDIANPCSGPGLAMSLPPTPIWFTIQLRRAILGSL